MEKTFLCRSWLESSSRASFSSIVNNYFSRTSTSIEGHNTTKENCILQEHNCLSKTLPTSSSETSFLTTIACLASPLATAHKNWRKTLFWNKYYVLEVQTQKGYLPSIDMGQSIEETLFLGWWYSFYEMQPI